MMHYSLDMIPCSFLFSSLCPFVLYKCIGIIYVFGVESSQESIGEVSFAIGTFSGDDRFQFCSMFRAWFHEMWCAQEFVSWMWQQRVTPSTPCWFCFMLRKSYVQVVLSQTRHVVEIPD